MPSVDLGVERLAALLVPSMQLAGASNRFAERTFDPDAFQHQPVAINRLSVNQIAAYWSEQVHGWNYAHDIEAKPIPLTRKQAGLLYGALKAANLSLDEIRGMVACVVENWWSFQERVELDTGKKIGSKPTVPALVAHLDSAMGFWQSTANKSQPSAVEVLPTPTGAATLPEVGETSGGFSDEEREQIEDILKGF